MTATPIRSNETNTLVIYKLRKPLIEKTVQELSAENFPGIVRWIQLGFLRRVLAVFSSVEAASTALPRVKSIVSNVNGCESARVGFSMTTNDSLAESHLALPDTGTLLFVSPPPSPPNEWKTQLEEEPNQRTHYEAEFNAQLSRALKAYQETPSPGASPVDAHQPNSPRDQDPESPRTITIIEARASNPALNVTTSED